MQDLFPDGQDGLRELSQRSAVFQAMRDRKSSFSVCAKHSLLFSKSCKVWIITVPILKEAERQQTLIHLSQCSCIKSAGSPPVCPVAGDMQPPLQWLLMVTAVAQEDQGTSNCSFTAALPQLLQGSQSTRYCLWGYWEKYLLFFLYSVKIICWLFQMIIVSYGGENKINLWLQETKERPVFFKGDLIRGRS